MLVAASACLLLIAYLSFGALLVLLTQALPTGLSLIALFCNPAFGFAGVGFPVVAMGAFPQVWGSILPLRWYLQILFDQAARGLPASDSVRPFMILAGLACLYFALAWARLRAIAYTPSKREETPVIRLAIRARNRHRDEQRSPARSWRPRGPGPDRACAARLWGALPATLSRAGSSRHPDRRRRSGSNGAQPQPRADPERGRGDRSEGAERHHRRRPSRARPPRGFRHPRDSQRYGASGSAGREGADRSLCRRSLFPSLQPHAAGDIGGRGDGLRRHCDARRASRGKPRLCGDGPQQFTDRVPLPASVQPDRRLCELCRARRLSSHPPTDAAARRRVARRGGLRARRVRQTVGFDPGRAPSSAKGLRISASRCQGLRSI